jgi:hypothetical protein
MCNPFNSGNLCNAWGCSFVFLVPPPPAQAIIDPALWDAVQARLAENAFERAVAVGIRVKNPILLAGSLFDGEVQRMTPTHAVENGKRYCYYVSRPLIIDARTNPAIGRRIPAVGDRAARCEPDPPVAFGAASLFEIIKDQADERLLQQTLIAGVDKRAFDGVGWPKGNAGHKGGLVKGNFHLGGPGARPSCASIEPYPLAGPNRCGRPQRRARRPLVLPISTAAAGIWGLGRRWRGCSAAD